MIKKCVTFSQFLSETNVICEHLRLKKLHFLVQTKEKGPQFQSNKPYLLLSSHPSCKIKTFYLLLFSNNITHFNLYFQSNIVKPIIVCVCRVEIIFFASGSFF